MSVRYSEGNPFRRRGRVPGALSVDDDSLGIRYGRRLIEVDLEGLKET